MKVVLPKETNGGKKKFDPPPLPLVQETIDEDDKLKFAKFRLRTEPTNDTSPTYDFHMRKITGDEEVRCAIRFATDILKILTGLHITTDEATVRLYRELLQDEALNQFNQAITKAIEERHLAAKKLVYDTRRGAPHNEDHATATAAADLVPVPDINAAVITIGMRAVITYMAPHKALTKQKRWMRRACRKPAGMSIRSFANHVTRINNDELPMLPPFGNRREQMLSLDEVIDVIQNGIPRSWIREMDKQGFDPIEKTLAEVVDFCERMENAEDFDSARDGGKTKSDNKVPRKDSSAKKSKSEGGKYCLLHGNNGSHNTDDCMVLKNQAKALRNNDGDRKPAYKNKTWKRDADKSTNSSKKELAAFVRKQARKELYAFAKKRKASEDDDDKSVNAMEQGEIDFSEFNFGNMDNLKIDSDDSDDDSKNGDEVSV
jgi:hypothetical protein